LGFSDRQVGWIMLGISALSFTLIASIVTFIPGWNLAYAALFLAGFLTVLIGLYSSTQLKKAREKFHEIGQS
ncbi:MAG: hypothetical protein AAGB22_03165, partial [Bacteroidota bacterium]